MFIYELSDDSLVQVWGGGCTLSLPYSADYVPTLPDAVEKAAEHASVIGCGGATPTL